MLYNKYYVTYPKLKKQVHMGSSDIQIRVWEAQLVKELKQGDLLVTSYTTENSRILNFMARRSPLAFFIFFFQFVFRLLISWLITFEQGQILAWAELGYSLCQLRPYPGKRLDMFSFFISAHVQSSKQPVPKPKKKKKVKTQFTILILKPPQPNSHIPPKYPNPNKKIPNLPLHVALTSLISLHL